MYLPTVLLWSWFLYLQIKNFDVMPSYACSLILDDLTKTCIIILQTGTCYSNLKKWSWKTKAFLNDLDIPETSDLRKKDIEEEVVLELWVILENFRMGPLPKMSNLWLGKSWQVYVMLCYQFFGLSSSVGQVVILLAGYHCCNPQRYATTNIQLTQEITSFIA